MFNEDTYKLILEILRSDIKPDAKTEIVKFYTLPRNTAVRPLVELPDDKQREQLGPIKRPDKEELDKRANPQLRGEEEEMKKTFDKINR